MFLNLIICYFGCLQLKSPLALLFKCALKEGCPGLDCKVSLEEQKHPRKKELKP